MNVKDWTKLQPPDFIKVTPVVPDARAGMIRHQHRSEHDQRRQGASYYVNVTPRASWGDLAKRLYECEENSAIQSFKACLPKQKGNQCDCIECVGAVCSDSVHSAL